MTITEWHVKLRFANGVETVETPMAVDRQHAEEEAYHLVVGNPIVAGWPDELIESAKVVWAITY